jgi:predicted nucleic acid-binding protein
MKDKFFLDTNIFVYQFDLKASPKRKIAIELIKKAHLGTGIISTQIIQEFLNVATKKFSNAMTTSEAETYLSKVLFPICEIFPSKILFSSALEIKERWKFSFYESLVIASAQEANCNILYSEDLRQNQKIGDLTIINPFNS